MSDRNYYVLCEDNCKFPAMTKEQILAAIEQAISTGKIHDVDAGFITKIKEQNRNGALKFWVGTKTEYNAIDKKEHNCFYITTDDVSYGEVCAELKTEIDELSEAVNATIEALYLEIENKAPAGFGGYGEEIRNFGEFENEAALEAALTEACDERISLATPVRFRCAVANFAGVNCGKAMWDCDMVRTSEGHVMVTGRSLFTGSGVTIIRKAMSGGVWLPVEWDKPPLLENVEYRTTERWKGKPVYTKVFRATVTDNGANEFYLVAGNKPGEESWTYLVRHHVTHANGGDLMPYYPWSADYFECVYFDTETYTFFYNRGNAITGTKTLVVQAWYTKE